MSSKTAYFQQLSDQYFDAVTTGDQRAATEIINSALDTGLDVLGSYDSIIAPALRKIGKEWQEERLSISEEHLATQITLEQMTLLRQRILPKPPLNKRALIATLSNDLHVLGARMIADFFYADGWSIEFLGANTPVDALITSIEEKEIDVTLISISSPEVIPELNLLADKLSSLKRPPMLIVGGRALLDSKTHSLIQGADLILNDPREAVQEARKHCGVVGSDESLEQVVTLLGQRIHKFRTNRGISQQALSQVAQLDRAYLSSIENGKKNPTLSAIWRIAEALEVRLSDLLE